MDILSKLYHYQKEAVTKTFYNPKGIICLPTGTGKCLAKGTKILMYNGTIKNVEDVIVGDLLMGDDSKPRKVLSLARGRENMYDIIPTKGDKYTVNESHILSLRVTGIGKNNLTILDKKYRTGDIVDITVKDYLNVSKTAKHSLKGFRVGVDFEEQKEELPLNPYLLGLWLADGNSRVQGISVNPNDVEIIDFLEKEAINLDLNLKITNDSENCKYFSLNTKFKGRASKDTNIFLNVLRDLNLINNKHIPLLYKTASRKERMDLLAGILDGDGHLSSNCFEITLVNETLMDDLIFLIRSLGFSCYKKNKIAKINKIDFEGEYFRCHISGDTDTIPTLLPRKKATKRGQIKNVLNVGVKVELVGEGDYYGFEIDGNRRFVLGDFTVTHNTFCQSAIIGNDILMNPGQFRIYVVNAPRILLTYQLLKEVYAFLTLSGNDKTKEMIVLHYDILAEGIDVSGFTGIMPLRTLNKSKFLQTFGRCARLDKEDRVNLEKEMLTVENFREFNKPFAYIIIPNVIHSNEDDKSNLTQLITELRDYGFNPSEDIVSASMVNGIPEIEELKGLNEIKNKIPNIGNLIENLEAEIESEENAKLTKKEFLFKNI